MFKLKMDSVIVVFFLIPNILTHSFILSLDGKNGVRSTAFGTRFTLRGALEQNTGIIKDQEISSGLVGPCGKIFGGDHMQPFTIDPQHELELAEASGIPTADDKSGIQMGVFVHNADGAGPFYCDYSSDASLKSFEPMNVTLQIEGDHGINPASKDYVYTLSAAFFPNATCSGGKGKDTCVMRCRNELGFGSCAAVKLDPSFTPVRNLSEPLSHENQGLERRSMDQKLSKSSRKPIRQLN